MQLRIQRACRASWLPTELFLSALQEEERPQGNLRADLFGEGESDEDDDYTPLPQVRKALRRLPLLRTWQVVFETKFQGYQLPNLGCVGLQKGEEQAVEEQTLVPSSQEQLATRLEPPSISLDARERAATAPGSAVREASAEEAGTCLGRF